MPFEEVGSFLVEKMEFGQEEAIEVLEHAGCWWLLGWGKVGPVKVGLDDAIAVGVAQVRGEGCRIGEE